ncbi:lysophospholipase L1-like esterase [Flavobacterium cutihirudinis]|uniref:Lysophospholipase L1-like esterase n=1 Tax=Flavobacterium cutihirudinis TaxID=1265740 RepID=A0A3D9FWQ1_9FLAO|nr:SGNH/GDSL hydrolase family protein [Flavobacterium cutihirudinis]RED25170.1 lysophospholipase L1-like esterase [Flavobacterium cutihirudinis]
MKTHFKQIVTVILSIFLLSCSSDDSSSGNTVTPPVNPPTNPTTPTMPIAKKVNYLALGDSYTIGQSVCETCRYPEQLKTSLTSIYPETTFSLKVIATTGWTTSNLISAINTQNLDSNYDLVTLLIGVNNQYQHLDFSVYEKEFPQLLNKAISLAKGDNKNVIVLSIPDYAYTPFTKNYTEQNRMKISNEIDQYNNFAESYCITKNVAFISITDITRQGLNNPNLVASDGLHPSETAYKMFVERMLSKVKMILQD